MRITVNSPDGVGDLIMRMPLLQTLLADGHDLQLLVRSSTGEFAQGVFPESEVHVFTEDPYNQELKKRNHPFRADFSAVRRFKPDLYVAGTFFLNFFDEELIIRGGNFVPMAGFEAQDDRWGSNTILDPFELARRFAIRIPVPAAMPEADKYQRMANALAGRAVSLKPPRQPPAEMMDIADDLMARKGLQRDGFHVACVGGRHGLRMKDWGERNWAEFFSEVATTSKKPIVFLGNREESASVERIRAALPPGARHISLAAEPPPILVSYALVARSAGYLGRDGGVMHMAAATGRPLLALFSGVHWPRFVPKSPGGLIVSVQSPCRGCNRQCPFPEPYCITRIPVEGVVQEWRQWEGAQRAKVVEFTPDGTFTEALAGIDAVSTSWERQLEQRRRWQAEKASSWWRTISSLFRH